MEKGGATDFRGRVTRWLVVLREGQRQSLCSWPAAKCSEHPHLFRLTLDSGWVLSWGWLLGLLRSLWCCAAADSHTASVVPSSAQRARFEGRYSVILGLEPHLWLLTQMKVGTPAGVLSLWFCGFLAEFRGLPGGLRRHSLVLWGSSAQLGLRISGNSPKNEEIAPSFILFTPSPLKSLGPKDRLWAS